MHDPQVKGFQSSTNWGGGGPLGAPEGGKTSKIFSETKIPRDKAATYLDTSGYAL